MNSRRTCVLLAALLDLTLSCLHPAVKGWDPAPLDIHACQRIFLEN